MKGKRQESLIMAECVRWVRCISESCRVESNRRFIEQDEYGNVIIYVVGLILIFVAIVRLAHTLSQCYPSLRSSAFRSKIFFRGWIIEISRSLFFSIHCIPYCPSWLIFITGLIITKIKTGVIIYDPWIKINWRLKDGYK